MGDTVPIDRPRSMVCILYACIYVCISKLSMSRGRRLPTTKAVPVEARLYQPPPRDEGHRRTGSQAQKYPHSATPNCSTLPSRVGNDAKGPTRYTRPFVDNWY